MADPSLLLNALVGLPFWEGMAALFGPAGVGEVGECCGGAVALRFSAARAEGGSAPGRFRLLGGFSRLFPARLQGLARASSVLSLACNFNLLSLMLTEVRYNSIMKVFIACALKQLIKEVRTL